MKLLSLFLFALLSLPVMIQTSFAAVDSNTSAPEKDDEPQIPDAMARLLKAPDIDVENIRDPFLSVFEKNRMDEAARFKNRKRLPANKRKREPLEMFDLSTLTLVATFKKAGHDWVASVQDSSGKSYTVRRGNYMGKRGGRIEKIDGQTIYLVEKMINPAGEIVDHQTTLTLAEVNDQP
jgi:type IV pilus assembly protein PilP